MVTKLCDIRAAILVHKLVLSLGPLDFITCIESGLRKKEVNFSPYLNYLKYVAYDDSIV